MNRQLSLAEEKAALLARMEASRVAYRRMLLGIDKSALTVQDVTPNDAFPRSTALRWMRDHPYLSALAVAALFLGPRRLARRALRGGRAAAATVARNRSRIRIAFGIATTVARLVTRRRQ